jgi:hypothetical protein
MRRGIGANPPPSWSDRPRSGFARGQSAISEDLYTFV